MRSYRLSRIGLLLTAILLTPNPAAAQTASAAPDQEVFTYRWRLGGFKGMLARLILPGAGEAVLRTGGDGDGRLISELHITSPESRRGEFWRYGAEIDSLECRRTRSAWTQQYFRGRAKEKRDKIEEDGIFDIPSSICRIRRQPPEQPILTRIWSDGTIYHVRIAKRATGTWRLGGRTVATRTFSVEGVKRPGERLWKGRLDVVLAQDEAVTPLEIALVQRGLEVRLRLVDR